MPIKWIKMANLNLLKLILKRRCTYIDFNSSIIFFIPDRQGLTKQNIRNKMIVE